MSYKFTDRQGIIKVLKNQVRFRFFKGTKYFLWLKQLTLAVLVIIQVEYTLLCVMKKQLISVSVPLYNTWSSFTNKQIYNVSPHTTIYLL